MEASESFKGRKNICGNRIKKLRRDTPGMTQGDLAAQLQVNGGDFVRLTINRIEKGERGILDYELVYLADILGVTLDYLVCGNLSVHETRMLLSKEKLEAAENAAAGPGREPCGGELAAEGDITHDTDTIGE